MEIADLIKFGLTPIEAQIYLELCKTDKTNMGPVIKRTGLHRGTVYNSLNQLIKKGLVSFVEEQGIKKYFVKSDSLFLIIQLKKQELEHQEELAKKFIKEIKKIPEKKQEVTIHIGQRAFKLLFNELIENSKIEKKEYCFIGDALEMGEIFGEEYLKRTQFIKKDHNVKCRLLLNESLMNHKLSRSVHGETKYLPKEYMFPAATWITDKKVMISLFDTFPPTTILISSENVAKNYKSYFDLLWNLPIKFDNKTAYRKRLVDLVRRVKKFDIMCRNRIAPFFIYPHTEPKFLKYRKAIKKIRSTLTGKEDMEIFRAYMKLWKRKAKVRYIVEKDSIDEFFKIIKENFGKKEYEKQFKAIKRDLKKYPVKIKILNEFNPITMYISEREFMITLPSGEEVFGFSTLEPEVKNTFSELYEEFWNRAVPIEDYLEKIEKK